jgi:SAM-dependent methyltransferase
MIDMLELTVPGGPAESAGIVCPDEVAAIPEMNAQDYRTWLEFHHPRLYSLMDPAIVNDPSRWADHFVSLGSVPGHQEFAEAPEKGRGRAYRERQKKYPAARQAAYDRIFGLLNAGTLGMSARTAVVDMLAGNGTLWRASHAALPLKQQPYLVCSDANEHMIRDAMLQGIPAIRQAAQRTLFAPEQLDAAFYGYGLHHISPEDRPDVLREAYRFLKPGGFVLLHDFEEGTPTARWYSEGLDRYTETGHKFHHFTAAGYRELLRDAGFQAVNVFPMYDAFVFTGPSADEVRFSILNHLVEMFGMVKLARTPTEPDREFCDRVEPVLAPFATFSAGDVAFEPDAFRRFVIFQQAPGMWRAEFPRIALMASAHKA